MKHEKEIDIEPIWAVVANIVGEQQYGPGGKATRYGTRTFRPGAKVYVIDLLSGMCESIIVVGLPRNSKRYITIIIRVDKVENLRVKLVYNPSVIKKTHKYFGDSPAYLTETYANEMCETIPRWQAMLEDNYKSG